jgi:hypothetical protein
MKAIKINVWLIMFFLCLLTGCEKYLDVKQNSRLVIPKTLQDLQGLLDNFSPINRTGTSSSESSADDYYLTAEDYLALGPDLKRLYTWEKDNVLPAGVNDWSRAYDRVFIANTVLDNIGNIDKTAANDIEWSDIKAQALFIRSYAFLEIASAWTLAYDAGSAGIDLGIPLRLHSDIYEKIVRSTLKQTYEQILNDLNEASSLARVSSVHTMRSSKSAVFALLARTHLWMRDYDNCLKNANLCLQIKNSLLDFNNNPPLNPAATFPFNVTALLYNNPEIIYISRMITPPTILGNAKCKIDSVLWKSYDLNDLRRSVYLKNNNNNSFGFKGSLEGSVNLFNGITTSEVYLMRAECYARKNMPDKAMDDLNALTIKRWNKNVVYPVFTANDGTMALKLVLRERRKELIMRGLRWMDVKRLNKEGMNIALKRVINGQTFLLPPNDNRFALAIPEEVIGISGITQNIR